MSRYAFFTSKIFWRILVIAWVFIIFWLSLDPAPPVPEPKIPGWDKFLHAIAYGCLTLFGGWALKESSTLRKSTWCGVAGAAILLGGIMELFQKAFTDTRTAEFADFLANAFGAGIVLLGVFCIQKFKRRHSNHHGNSTDSAGFR
jgi:VanZ family protein